MNPTQQQIDLTAGGYELTWPTILTELTGKDITAETVQMVLGGQRLGSSPDWAPLTAPHVLTTGTITAQRFMIENPGVRGVQVPDGTDPALFLLYWVAGQLFIGPTGLEPDPGHYYPFIQITDTPETPIRRGQKFTIL